MVDLPPNNNVPNIPPKPAAAPGVNSAPLNLGKLGTKASQKAYLDKRKKLPPLTFLLKYLAIISLTVVFVLYVGLRFDLDQDNTYLQIAGVHENTYKKHFALKNKNTTLQADIQNLSDQINEKKERIKKKYFFENQKEIELIHAEQKMKWFDTRDENGELVFGVFDSFGHMRNFFTASDYADIDGNAGVVGGRQLLSRNQIEVKNITIDEKSASFSVESSNIFGKIFFLSSEFIDMMNSFDFFKNGKIKSFTRQNLQGQDGMNFTLRLDIQAEDEEDPSDERFKEFLSWKNGLSSPSSSTSTRKPVSRPRTRPQN